MRCLTERCSSKLTRPLSSGPLMENQFWSFYGTYIISHQNSYEDPLDFLICRSKKYSGTSLYRHLSVSTLVSGKWDLPVIYLINLKTVGSLSGKLSLLVFFNTGKVKLNCSAWRPVLYCQNFKTAKLLFSALFYSEKERLLNIRNRAHTLRNVWTWTFFENWNP